MDTRLYESLLAESRANAGQFVVCGRALRPFCLLHDVQLRALENPLWVMGTKPDLIDLDIASQICASENPVVPQKPNAAKLRKLTFIRELGAWLKYIELCHATPKLKPPTQPSAPGSGGAPFEVWVVTYLSRKMNIPPWEAWTMPLGLAHWYLDTCIEQESGENWILSEDEEREIEEQLAPAAVAARRQKEILAGRIARAKLPSSRRLELLAMLDKPGGIERVRKLLKPKGGARRGR